MEHPTGLGLDTGGAAPRLCARMDSRVLSALVRRESALSAMPLLSKLARLPAPRSHPQLAPKKPSERSLGTFGSSAASLNHQLTLDSLRCYKTAEPLWRQED